MKVRLLSPVFWKELSQTANQRHTYILRGLFLGISLLAFMWLCGRAAPDTTAPVLSRQLFTVLFWIQFLVFAIFTPALSADSICGELRCNTLGLLYISRLSPFHIVQDKGLARLTHMLHLYLLSIPFLFACLLLGGVTTYQIIGCLGLNLAVVLLGAGVTILCSTYMISFTATLLTTLVLLACYYLLLPLLSAYIYWQLMQRPLITICWVHPLVAACFMFNEWQIRNIPFVVHSWAGCLAFSIVVYLICVWLASRRLRRLVFAEGADKPPARFSLSWMWRKLAAFSPVNIYIYFLQGASHAPVRGNPIIWREAREKSHLVLMRFSILGLPLLVLLYLILNDQLRYWEVHTMLWTVFLVVTTVLAGFWGVRSFTHERDQTTLPLLLTTGLSARDLVWGKFMGMLRTFVPVFSVLIIILIVATDYCPRFCFCIWPSLLNMLIYTCLWFAIGIYISLTFHKSLQATIGLIGVYLLVTSGGLFGALLAEEIWGSSGWGDGLVKTSPVYWICLCSNPNKWQNYRFEWHWYYHLAVCLLATYGLLQYSIWRFRYKNTVVPYLWGPRRLMTALWPWWQNRQKHSSVPNKPKY